MAVLRRRLRSLNPTPGTSPGFVRAPVLVDVKEERHDRSGAAAICRVTSSPSEPPFIECVEKRRDLWLDWVYFPTEVALILPLVALEWIAGARGR